MQKKYFLKIYLCCLLITNSNAFSMDGTLQKSTELPEYDGLQTGLKWSMVGLSAALVAIEMRNRYNANQVHSEHLLKNKKERMAQLQKSIQKEEEYMKMVQNNTITPWPSDHNERQEAILSLKYPHNVYFSYRR